ncbi:MAG: helix-turn-helix transcriptional regulator [Treponema sp.]|nr:helix-turn-helix transcriptional regulator [Treponema sp.]
MTLQETFIVNLKKFRKKRGISQMALAQLCDTSGNYIGEIETGRRIPSFEKIEKIAWALQIASYQLFVQETSENAAEEDLQTGDFLNGLPHKIKREITGRLLSAIHKCIDESFDANNY